MSRERDLRTIIRYCKGISPRCAYDGDSCVLRRNCIESWKCVKYNDPKFLAKQVRKVEKALTEDLIRREHDPFEEYR